MKKNLKRLFLCSLILLLALAGGALAETSDSAAEEVVLIADLAAFRETGELFEGVKPGMSLEEVLAAGLPLNTDTWVVGMLTEENERFDSKENHVVMMENIRMAGSELLGAFSCLFHSNALCSIDLYLEEEMALEEALPIITAVLGEPTHQNTTEYKYMSSLDYSTQVKETTNITWEFDLDGKIIQFSTSADDWGEGATCWYFSVTYMNYIQSTDEAE